MQPFRYFQIKAAVECGDYACLRDCCGQFWQISRLFESPLPEKDIRAIEQIICGCAIVTEGQATPSIAVPQLPPSNVGTALIPSGTNICYSMATKFIAEHLDVLTSLEVGLTALSGWSELAPDAQPYVTAILSAIRGLRGIDPSEDSTGQRAANALCGFAQTLVNLLKKVKGALPTALSPIFSMMTSVYQLLLPWLTEQCCSQAVQEVR